MIAPGSAAAVWTELSSSGRFAALISSSGECFSSFLLGVTSRESSPTRSSVPSSCPRYAWKLLSRESMSSSLEEKKRICRSSFCSNSSARSTSLEASSLETLISASSSTDCTWPCSSPHAFFKSDSFSASSDTVKMSRVACFNLLIPFVAAARSFLANEVSSTRMPCDSSWCLASSNMANPSAAAALALTREESTRSRRIATTIFRTTKDVENWNSKRKSWWSTRPNIAIECHLVARDVAIVAMPAE